MEAGLGICVGMRSAPLREGAKLTMPAEVRDTSSCGVEGKRRMYWCHVPSIEGCWSPAVHSNCVHNERASLLLRTLGPTPEDPGHKYLDEAFASLANLIVKKNVARWSRERVVQSYSGRLRRRYLEALDSLREDGQVNRMDKRLSAFLKAEKFNPLLKPSKPRMIMARSPRFNLELASYLKPLEHALWKCIKGESYEGTATRQVGKGLNAPKRADLLRRKMLNIGGGCVVFEVDGKSFEAHVTTEDIRREHAIYRSAYKGDENLSKLLDTQLVLKGVTSGGIRYRRSGARASGDFNTGLGNTLIMVASLRACFKLLREEMRDNFRWDMLCDGDNALIFLEPRVASQVHKRFAESVRLVSSQELAVESPVTELEQVVFGQCKPCVIRNKSHGSNDPSGLPEVTMVRDPLKTLSNAFSSYRHYENYGFGVKVLKSVAQCELALARGIPVLEAYFGRALELVGNVPDLTDPSSYLEGRHVEAISILRSAGETLADVKPIGVSAEARISFEKAWGIGVEMQLELEDRLRAGVNFPLMDGGLWSRLRMAIGSRSWKPIYLTDGPDGEARWSSIVYFLGERV